ncbi:MAG TPA: head GIN domain-containing protein, partial [Sphingomicrobium sp.]|nr:head GIN domain-containing protein [Sphingomicrobium sp.]
EMSRQNVLLVAAATLVSAALILPTSGVVAKDWTSVSVNHMPMVEGSGRVVQQSRNVGDFRAVRTMGSENVEVRFGPRSSVVIAADDNILPLLSTRVVDGTLKLESRGSYRTHNPIRVWITTPRLDEFTTMGSGDVVIHDVNTSSIKLTLQGSGDIQANGRAGELDLTLMGSGRARLADLSATDVTAGIFGSGEATVRASGKLDAQMFGSGSLRYIGNPASLRSSHFGSGRIIAAN